MNHDHSRQFWAVMTVCALTFAFMLGSLVALRTTTDMLKDVHDTLEDVQQNVEKNRQIVVAIQESSRLDELARKRTRAEQRYAICKSTPPPQVPAELCVGYETLEQAYKTEGTTAP